MNRFLMRLIVVWCVVCSPTLAMARSGVEVPFVISTLLTEPLAISFSYTSINVSWTTSPGAPKQEPRQELMRAQFIHENSRELVEELALGNGPVLQSLISFYVQNPTHKKQMLRHFKRTRKMQQHLLLKASFKTAVQFERHCVDFAHSILLKGL